MINISAFVFQDRYDEAFQKQINNCSVITVSDLAQPKSDMKCAQLRYSNEKEFETIANTLQIMSDFKVKTNQFHRFRTPKNTVPLGCCKSARRQ